MRRLLVAATSLVAIGCSTAAAEMFPIYGKAFYMAADAGCAQKPIFTESVWLECTIGEKHFALVARSSVDMVAPPRTNKYLALWPAGDDDAHLKMLALLVEGTELEARITYARWAFGSLRKNRLSATGFLFDSASDKVADEANGMWMFNAFREVSGRGEPRTIGIVAIGDYDLLTGADASAIYPGASTVSRMPKSAEAMVNSFRPENDHNRQQ